MGKSKRRKDLEDEVKIKTRIRRDPKHSTSSQRKGDEKEAKYSPK